MGDLLSEFAEVNIYTLDNIKQIPRFVKDGLPIDIVLMRKLEGKEENGDKSFALKDGQRYLRVDLKVTPTIWEGKGLLGCKFNPL